MHDLLDQILKLWAAEFGSKELAVKNLLARASKPLLEMFLRVASDPQDRHRIHPRLLGVFLGNNRGIPAAGWKLSDRSRNRQSLWWLEPATFKKERKFTEEPAEPVKIAESMFEKRADHAQLSPAEMLGRNLVTALVKMPTWKTMVVPVRSISLGENSFFETWLAEHNIDAADTALTDMPHVIEEQRPAKSFDLVHEAMADSPPPANEVSGTEKPELEEEAPGIKEAARRANVERQRRYRERKKAMAEAEAKGDEPAPSARWHGALRRTADERDITRSTFRT